jgi:VIT1/CCC1 family predicted Fe2+/Mn2+ transporter
MSAAVWAQPWPIKVAGKLMAHDALGAHARDELGHSDATAARPTQAALASAASFAVGAVLPIAVVALVSPAHLVPWVSLSALVFLAGLGALSARVGGAPVWIGTWRVAFWGAGRVDRPDRRGIARVATAITGAAKTAVPVSVC